MFFIQVLQVDFLADFQFTLVYTGLLFLPPDVPPWPQQQLAELVARVRAPGWRLVGCTGGLFPKSKAHPTDLEGPHRQVYPAAIATQAVAKQSKHQGGSSRPGQQPAQQGITKL